VVARELGCLAPPEIDAFAHPVGFVSGAIDLVYRDPGDDRLVVADWKSDRVESEVEIAQRTSIYGAQVRSYAAALRAALALDYEPRAELWFLHPGRVAVVSPR
jgi:ATP-dependent exoDNAse (exonuclease V) beta subunit